MALYVGLVASVSEAVSDLLFGLDDNLTIPVLSAIFLWLPLVHFQLGW
jgi:diacylglycerol kinase (CTP)